MIVAHPIEYYLVQSVDLESGIPFKIKTCTRRHYALFYLRLRYEEVPRDSFPKSQNSMSVPIVSLKMSFNFEDARYIVIQLTVHWSPGAVKLSMLVLVTVGWLYEDSSMLNHNSHRWLIQW